MPSDTSESTSVPIEELLENFSSGSLRQRRRLVDEIESRSKDLVEIGEKLFKTFIWFICCAICKRFDSSLQTQNTI